MMLLSYRRFEYGARYADVPPIPMRMRYYATSPDQISRFEAKRAKTRYADAPFTTRECGALMAAQRGR